VGQLDLTRREGIRGGARKSETLAGTSGEGPAYPGGGKKEGKTSDPKRQREDESRRKSVHPF